METQRNRSPPFSIRLLKYEHNNNADTSELTKEQLLSLLSLLKHEHNNNADTSEPTKEQLLSLLPASYRTDDYNITAPSGDVTTCIKKELNLERLNRVDTWLWMAGRPMPPRPLHYQLLLGREIFVAEQMDMHLVWTTGRIFLKPVPRFLLEPHFWIKYLCCREYCSCSKEGEVIQRKVEDCGQRKLWKCAVGFLFSYAALISHESDFHIAKEKLLLPREEQLTWQRWRTLVEQLDTEHIYSNIDVRFVYGELRLSRLNKIYVLSQRPLLRGYMPHWHQYSTFFQDNFAWLASTTVYIAIVLTAMQVGLATRSLSDNNAFQSASYGFTVFSILGPLAAASLIVLAFCYVFVTNFVATVSYKKRRFRDIQLRPES